MPVPVIDLDNVDDERLFPFRNMRQMNWTAGSGRFIAEGPLLVERLLSSDYQVHSLLVDRKYMHHFVDKVPEECLLMVVSHEMVEQIVGYNFHRGILGCGIRKPQLKIDGDFATNSIGFHSTMLAAVGIQDPENLGGILRSCAALGIEQVVIGPGTADPLSRRVLRVSMGNALRLRLYRSQDILADMQWLKGMAGVESIATSLAADSQLLEQSRRTGPLLLLMGNEKHGLPEPVQRAADRRIRIDMQLGTDSLNVTTAAGIIAHYFCRLA
jgi:tRNA G18 (ribose-2'-O)-methylase SpoU